MNTGTETIYQKIQQTRQAQERQRQVRNLTASLAAMIQLKTEGQELVAQLGRGDEANNLVALETWVARELKQLDSRDFQPLDYLFARIQIRLGPIDEGQMP